MELFAFHAVITLFPNVSIGSTMVFDRVLLNKGKGYDSFFVLVLIKRFAIETITEQISGHLMVAFYNVQTLQVVGLWKQFLIS